MEEVCRFSPLHFDVYPFVRVVIAGVPVAGLRTAMKLCPHAEGIIGAEYYNVLRLLSDCVLL